jgi:hypothetical protein
MSRWASVKPDIAENSSHLHRDERLRRLSLWGELTTLSFDRLFAARDGKQIQPNRYIRYRLSLQKQPILVKVMSPFYTLRQFVARGVQLPRQSIHGDCTMRRVFRMQRACRLNERFRKTSLNNYQKIFYDFFFGPPARQPPARSVKLSLQKC